MVGNDLELGIVNLFSKDITKLLSINQIATALNKRYPYINKKVTQMLNAGIFKKIVVGRSYLCSLNLQNDEAIVLLSLLEIRKKKRFLERNPSTKILEFIDENKDKIIEVLVVAKKVIIVSNELRKAVKGATVLNKKEFLQLLLKTDKVHSDHVILYSYEKHYECLREVETKLRIKNSNLI